jgi:hypothetical protein
MQHAAGKTLTNFRKKQIAGMTNLLTLLVLMPEKLA